MRHHTAWERLFGAVEYLASSTGLLQKRLENVYVSHLTPLRIADFNSNSAKEAFTFIMLPVREGKLSNGTLSGVSDEEASEISKKIVSLFNQITYFGDEE